MNELVELWERPAAARCMIAGWQQWADAGSVSSGLPQYLVKQTYARKIGCIAPDGFYLFQIPGAHHLLRPVVKLNEGHSETLQRRTNEFFYAGGAGGAGQGLFIFLGEEPHLHEDRYAEAFFDAVDALGVEKIAAVAGVYGPVPYDRARDISCVYSLPEMKQGLAPYDLRFSNYEGGTTISTYLADQAEARGIEFFALYALVPAYDFSVRSLVIQRIAINEDFKAWYDIVERLNRILDLELELTDLARLSEDLIGGWAEKMSQLEQAVPQLDVQSYMEKIDADFTEESSARLDDVWGEALQDLFDEDELL